MNLIIPILKRILYLQLISSTSAFIFDNDVKQSFPKTFTRHSEMSDIALKYLTTIHNCICEVNPGYIVSCHGNNCETFPATLNISEPLLKIKVTSISVIRKDDLQSMAHLSAFELEANFHLVRIEPGCFRSMSKLENLTLSSNTNLKHLESNVFEGLINLNILYLSKSGFTQVEAITQALSPKYLPKLYLLDMTENMFHEVRENDFFPMNGTSLKQLNLLLCQIVFIDPDSFAPLRHLTHLRLGQNLCNRTTLTNVVTRTLEMGIPLVKLNLYESGLRRTSPYAMFEAIGKSKLLYLNFAKNHYDNIDDDFFPDMPNLITIDLRDCLITYISPNAFKKLPNLNTIWIGENRLSSIPEGVIKNNLEILDIAANSNDGSSQSYFYVKDRILSNMTALLNLQLLFNNIGFFTKNSFIGLSNLETLNLKTTSLYQFDVETFRPLGNLTYLNLMNNPFPKTMSLTADIFLGLGKLKILMLGGCSITNLTSSPSLFIHLKNLTELFLEQNGLHIISPNQLTVLSNLRMLSLEENSLTPWKNSILPHENLIYLDAHSNRFTHITTAMLEDWKSLQSLKLDGNPLRCDCELNNVAVWLRTNEMEVVKFCETNGVIATCVDPVKWQGKSVADYMDHINQDQTICEIYIFYTEPFFIASVSVFIIFLLTIAILTYKFKLYIRYWIFLARLTLRKHHIFRIPNKPNTIYKYDAFISYCKEDCKFVAKLVEELENNEPYFKLCIYERDFQIGAMISESILHSVVLSKRTILVVSDAFAQSHWCRWETQLAEYHKLFFLNDSDVEPDGTLLIIKLDAVAKKNLTPTLRFLMKTRIYLEWDEELRKQELFWVKLRATLAVSKIGKI